MLRRDSDSCLAPAGRSLKPTGSRDKDKCPPSFAASPPPVPLNSEMLRELKRRVLVCLDNNAAAAEVARRLLSDRNSDFTKLSGGGRRHGPESSTVRRKGEPERGGSPFEIVSECFEMLDRLLSDIARKDAEIERLQKELAAAERLCRSYESRVSHLQESCSRVGRPLYNGAFDRPLEAASTATITTTGASITTAAAAAPASPAAPRSPRKPRRSSMEMLSLPSIHDSGEAALEAAGGTGGRKRAAEAAEAVGAKRLRLEARCKEEPKEPEEVEAMEVKEEPMEEAAVRADTEKARSRKGKKKRGRLSVTAAAAAVTAPDPPPEERLSRRFGPCLTTPLSYCFGDFDSMLERRERERERKRAEAEIHTPGWRIAPACGRTRAATLAAAVGSSLEACTALADSEMPEEGPGFTEWAALSDEPFEARHRRMEQAEQKRDRAELRAIRERQRHARLRQRQIYVGLPTAGVDLLQQEPQLQPAGKEPFVSGSGGSSGGGVASSDAEAAAVALAAAAGPTRRGLPESLMPSGLEEGEAKDCCIYYYPKDKVPVVAFGRLLPARKKKSNGFSLPWIPKKGR